jgi:hypothetical protein
MGPTLVMPWGGSPTAGQSSTWLPPPLRGGYWPPLSPGGYKPPPAPVGHLD